MKTITTIYCRYCQGQRPTNGTQCLGCGAEAARAAVVSRKRTRKPRKCPKCGAGNYVETRDADRFECRSCGCFFEDADFGFVDHRPEENAMKKERRRA